MLLVMTSTTVYGPTKVAKILLWDETLTRMHSSSGCVGGEGPSDQRGVCPGGVYLPGGVSVHDRVSARRCLPRGGVCR